MRKHLALRAACVAVAGLIGLAGPASAAGLGHGSDAPNSASVLCKTRDCR